MSSYLIFEIIGHLKIVRQRLAKLTTAINQQSSSTTRSVMEKSQSDFNENYPESESEPHHPQNNVKEPDEHDLNYSTENNSNKHCLTDDKLFP